VPAGACEWTTDSRPEFFSKELVAMKTESRLTSAPLAVVVLLALLALLMVSRERITAEEAEIGAVGAVVNLKNTILKHERALVAVIFFLALFAFVFWTEFRSRGPDHKSTLPAEESNASGTKEFR
jgi:hypothetical protein